MENILKTTLIGLFFGTFGTTIGGIIGVKFKYNSNKFLSFILAFAAGLMTAIVCFELIPEAMQISSLSNVILGIVFGIIMMIFCDVFVNKRFNKKQSKNNKQDDKSLDKDKLLKTGIIVSIGLAIHNLPEGLAIGSGFEASIKLGLSLAIAICFHDIPEGISMAVPMKNGGMSKRKNYLLCCTFGCYDRNWCLFWCNCGRNFRKNNCYLPSLCCRSNDLYCFWGVSARSKYFI